MSWPTAPQELEELQREVASARPPVVELVAVRSVGGCFVCFQKGGRGPGDAGDVGWAAAVVMEGPRIDREAVVEGEAGAPYRPGLLAAREGRLLAKAVAALGHTPDVILVNATGLDHPRRAGLAVQLGWDRQVPTVGVTNRTLVATGEAPGPWPGSRSPLWIGSDQVGWWLRAKRGAKPLAVTPGWATRLESALEIVESVIRVARTPEPIRQARRLARSARATAGNQDTRR